MENNNKEHATQITESNPFAILLVNDCFRHTGVLFTFIYRKKKQNEYAAE